MAETPTILRSNTSAATRLALWLLSALVLVQSAVLLWLLLPHQARQAKTLADEATPVQVAAPQAMPPPALSHLGALPPPPSQSLPSAVPGVSSLLAKLPPPPEALSAWPKQSGGGNPLPAPMPSPQRSPVPSSRVAPTAPTPIVPAAPTPIPVPAAPVSLTQNAEVDEIVRTAREMLALNDKLATSAALESLQRADLMLPEHPVVLRDMALAHQKLGNAARAAELFERANRAAAQASPKATSGTVERAGQVVSLRLKEVKRDMTCTTGEKQIVCLELVAAPGAVLNAENINLDVFFYDSVDGTRVETSKCDKPVWEFATPVDFRDSGVESVKIVYHMPRMNEAEEREHGKRKFHGFSAKLYHSGAFMGELAYPQSQAQGVSGVALKP